MAADTHQNLTDIISGMRVRLDECKTTIAIVSATSEQIDVRSQGIDAGIRQQSYEMVRQLLDLNRFLISRLDLLLDTCSDKAGSPTGAIDGSADDLRTILGLADELCGLENHYIKQKQGEIDRVSSVTSPYMFRVARGRLASLTRGIAADMAHFLNKWAMVPACELQRLSWAGELSRACSIDNTDSNIWRALYEAACENDAVACETSLVRLLEAHIDQKDAKASLHERRYQELIAQGLSTKASENHRLIREGSAGNGYFDIALVPPREFYCLFPAVVFECKVSRGQTDAGLTRAVSLAMNQLRNRGYGDRFRAEGIESVHEFAVGIMRRRVRVRARSSNS
jgi:hypothetical protein